MNSNEIAEKFQDAVVKIHLTWRLYARETGKQVFHKFVDGHPAYVRTRDGQVARWLVTDDERETNAPISGIGSGTGFVVNQRGFILTNKHIAAGGQTFYDLQPYEQEPKCKDCGRLYFETDMKEHPSYDVIAPARYREPLRDWLPGYEGCLFERKMPKRIICRRGQDARKNTVRGSQRISRSPFSREGCKRAGATCPDFL